MLDVILLGVLVCWILSGFWCPGVLKIHVITCSLDVEALSYVGCDILVVGRLDL